MAVSIRQALADDTEIDIGVLLVADQSYSESSIQELSDTITELCLSQRLLITVSIMGIDIEDDNIFENLVSILDKVPFGGNIDVIFEQDAKIKEVIRGLCTEIFDSFDNKLVVNYFGFELQTLTLTKEDG